MDHSGSRVIGLDLGGTWLKAVVLDARGDVFARDRRASGAAESAAAPLAAIRAATVELARFAGDDARIGLGCPGAIDPVTGTLGGATPHLPHWNDFPIAARAAAVLARPVHVENDANGAAYAEHRMGAARGAAVSMTITIGTGIGCGIVIAGRVLRGASGGAGELGHLPLGAGAAQAPGALAGDCRCGVAGCAEPAMSASGMVAAARAAGVAAVGVEELFAAAQAGDVAASALIERMIDRLAATIAVAAHTIDPDVIVVGGGVARAGDVLFDALEQALPRYVMASHRKRLRLVPAELGEWAGAIGAGLLAREAGANGE